MKILIATPSYGGIMTARYLNAFIETMATVNAAGHELSIFTHDRDALISRARNMCATLAVEMGFDKLLFVDADIVWEPEDVMKLLKSKKKIVGGTYPYKSFPIALVVNPLACEEFGDHDRSMTAYYNFVEKYADPKTKEVEVHQLPTGFLLIDTEVFVQLSKVTPKYKTWDSSKKVEKNVFDFFPIGLVNQPGTDVKLYQTEDWGFCAIAQKAGYKIYLQSDCIVSHMGFHTFSV